MADNEIKIRQANAEDYIREDFVRVFSDNGNMPPNPLISFTLLAEEDDKIIGFYVLQPVYHAEPMYVKEGYNNRNINQKLMHAMMMVLENMKGAQVFIFAPNEKVEHFAGKYGFKKLDYSVLEQRF